MFVGVMAPLVFSGSYEMAWSLVYTAVLAAALMWRQHWAWRIFWPTAAAALLFVVVLQERADRENAIVQVSSFYGTLRVTDEETEDAGRFRTLIHGTIQHGTQFMAVTSCGGCPPLITRAIQEWAWRWITVAKAGRVAWPILAWEPGHWRPMESRETFSGFMRLIRAWR